MNDFPKSKELLKKYLSKNITHPEGTPEEVVKAVKEFVTGDERINAIIEKEPNTLFEFFDDNKVYIHIEPFSNELENNLESFGWRILGKEYSNLDCKKRKQAETEAVLEAFKLLEEKL